MTRVLSEEQLARYQSWFDNARRLRELVAKLEIASVHTFQAASAPSHHGLQDTGQPLWTPHRLITTPGHSKSSAC